MPNTPNNNPDTQDSLNVNELVAKIEAAKDPNIQSIIALLKLVSDNLEDIQVKEILKSQDDFLSNIVTDSATAKESRALAEDFLSKKASGEIDYNVKKYIYRIGNLLKSAFSDDLIQLLQAEEAVDETELEEEATEDDEQAESIEESIDETYSEEEPAENNETIGPLSVKLSVVKDGDVIKEKTFNQDVIKIGSLTPIDSSHLYIDDPDISRLHAVIDIHKNGEKTIIDLGSETGIMVNGIKVLKALLNDGDTIQIGSVEIQFSNLLEAIKDKTKEDKENIFGTEQPESIGQSVLDADEETSKQELEAKRRSEEVNFYILEIQKLVEANNLQEALDLSQEVLKDHPNAEVLYFNAANIAEKMDDKRVASDFYKKLVVLTESNHIRRLAESRIQRLEEEMKLDEAESDTEETGESEPPFRVSFMPDAPEITEQPSEASEVVGKILREINGEPPEPAKRPSEPLPGPSDRSSILPLEKEDYILFSDEQIAEADQALHWDMIIQLREGFEETKKNIDPSAQPRIQGLKEHLEYVEGKYKKKFSTNQPPVESNEKGEEDGDVGKVGFTFSDRYRRFRKRLKKDGKEDGDPGDDLDMRANRGEGEEIEELDDEDIELDITTPEDIITQMPVINDLDMLEGNLLNVKEDEHVRVFNALSGNKITVENNAVVTIDILFSGVNIQLNENNSFVVINKTSKNCQGNPVEIIIKGKKKEDFDPIILGPKASREHISVLYSG